jgi:hypothetical protein
MVKVNCPVLDLPAPTRSILCICEGVIEYEIPLILLFSLIRTTALIGVAPLTPVEGTSGVVATETVRLDVPVLVRLPGTKTTPPRKTFGGPDC